LSRFLAVVARATRDDGAFGMLYSASVFRVDVISRGGTKSFTRLGLTLAMSVLPVAAGCSGSMANTGGGGSGGGTGGATAGAIGTSGMGGSAGGIGGGGTSGSGGAAVMQTCALFANKDEPIQNLSQTGCVSPTDPKQLAPSVFPYEVNSPLWSDGADKVRGMALPNGGKIHVKNCAANPSECPGPRDVADEGKWVLPVGTVMVKSFLFDNKLLETRLLMRFDATTFVGYTYKWDEAQTDATLVEDDREQMTFSTGQRTVVWNFPSRRDCLGCHLPEAGYVLGTETAQMNRVVGGTNQIDRLSAMGVFDAHVPKPYKPALVTPTPSQAGTPAASATIEQRATSYLHANCGFCHRPAEDIDCFSDPCQDLRFGLPLTARNLCNTAPSKGTLGVDGARNLVAGNPAQSLIWIRMTRPPDDAEGRKGRMPPIASFVVDQPAADLIAQWIRSIASCP
jgi:hypothetical protein